jgi:hypothetical protein
MVVNLWGGDRNFTTCVNRLSDAFNGFVACLPPVSPAISLPSRSNRLPGNLHGAIWKRAPKLWKRSMVLNLGASCVELAVMNPHDAERLLL